MKPLASCPRSVLANIRGVFTDIDETVSTAGHLTAEAYGALAALHKAGLLVVPVTGRPAGWCDHIARFWPVDAVVGENGAFWMWHDGKVGRLRTRFIQSDRSLGPERQQRRIEAARILADLAQTCSIPDLINLLADKDREVRFYAAQALVRLTRETPGGLTPSKWRDAPAEQREPALKAWQTWWGTRKKSYPCPRDDG